MDADEMMCFCGGLCRKPNRNDVEETNLWNTRRQTTLATFTIQPHASNQLRAGMYVHAYSHIVLICLRLPNNLNIVHTQILNFFFFILLISKLPSAPSQHHRTHIPTVVGTNAFSSVFGRSLSTIPEHFFVPSIPM